MASKLISFAVMRFHARRLPQFLAAIVSAAACDDLAGFSTGEGEIYEGGIVDGDLVRKGFEPGTRLEMTFDVDLADEGPGTITTIPPVEGGERLLDAAPLVPISSVKYDSLSGLDFPSGRLRNWIFLAPAAGRFEGRDAIVVVSLMSGGGVEARVLMARRTFTGSSCSTRPGDERRDGDKGIIRRRQ
jgi:hypothetical protein